MTATVQMKLASSRTGRIHLHLLALQKDHRLMWHIKGIIRELKKT